MVSQERELGKMIKPLAFGGHCFYVRKCMNGEAVEGAEESIRQSGGIVLPSSFHTNSILQRQWREAEEAGEEAPGRGLSAAMCADFCQWVEVWGKGPKIGQRCTKAHMRKFERARWIEDLVVPGMIMLCPNEHRGITPSPLGEDEFFIEESVPYLYYHGE